MVMFGQRMGKGETGEGQSGKGNSMSKIERLVVTLTGIEHE